MLDGTRREAVRPEAAVSLEEALRGSEVRSPVRVELVTTGVGDLWRIRATDATVLVDARTGLRKSPLTSADAQSIAVDAAARAKAQQRYGRVTRTDERPAETVVHFEGGARVTVGRDDLSVRQDGPDTTTIDWLYRIHYLQWTGHRLADRVLGVIGIVATWVLTALGAALYLRPSARATNPVSAAVK